LINIPPEIQLKATIKPGSVYYFVEESFRKTKEPHFFVVINHDPIENNIILLVYSSSMIENVKKRRRDCPDTLVEVKKEQYEDFTKDSIFDCNEVLDKTMGKLVNKLENNKLKFKSEIDLSIVEKLREAVCKSEIVEDWIIELLKK